jgi:hypothetical protein
MIEARSRHLALVIPLVVIAGIGVGVAIGAWQTGPTKEPARFASGDFAGKANPADIRGSYTLADVAAAFPAVTVTELAEAFGAPPSGAATFQVKSLESGADAAASGLFVGTDSMRLYVAVASGLPYAAAATTGLPRAAVALLEARGGLDPAALADARARIIPDAKAASPNGTPAASPAQPNATSAQAASPAQPAASATPTGGQTTQSTAAAAPAIKGKTTFKDLADWGVTKEMLRALLGDEGGVPEQTIKDYATASGKDFETLRTSLQKLLDGATAGP